MSKSFLQSKAWSEFQNSLGRKTFWVKNRLVIKHNLPLGKSFLYCPRPCFLNEKIFKEFLREAKKIALQENSIFLRIEPDLKSNIAIERYSNRAMKQSKCIQPQDTLILDLGQSEEKILADMHQKTRYNIRLARKHRIKIKKSINPNDIDIFWRLALKTSQRDGFRYHPKDYYRKMLDVLGKNNMLNLYIAEYNKKAIAAILILFYKDTAVYLHGASNHGYRNLMAPHLLQWQVIQDAKKKGYKFYDFWGITTVDNSDHPWSGITRFKEGFAPEGKIIHYSDCLDIICQPFWYTLYNMAKKIKP